MQMMFQCIGKSQINIYCHLILSILVFCHLVSRRCGPLPSISHSCLLLHWYSLRHLLQQFTHIFVIFI